MAARIMDGREGAARVRAEVTEGVAAFVAAHGRPPGLVGIQVGDDPASEIYQANKARQAAECGMASRRVTLPGQTTQAELDAVIDALNADDGVDGMLVQLPVPPQLAEPLIANRIHPDKDVDGFGPANLGRLIRGEPANVPCTPTGVMRMLDDAGVPLEGADAVVVGRSLIVGKPQALLLLDRNATVTIAHSRTRDLPALCRRADVLVAAVGRAEMIRGDWVKPGAAVVDVGINRTDDGLRGDVAFDEVAEVAGWITPVPGGVGPMTIAYLLANTLAAAWRRAGGDPHDNKGNG
ncbi:MAG TPA: bifunctional methylenetetrahydrofolate dehydrogenase/methenyltetrahydrofolate cyclohydrolase FolD [Miltoncostaeaceae bacterium]|nr:bifunctional methylenetetrahydrofolate dehydrogenase/methenyltetrahydrofolate cyclohydrolase FolD [Miltoncostaeaceae bacterium]